MKLASFEVVLIFVDCVKFPVIFWNRKLLQKYLRMLAKNMHLVMRRKQLSKEEDWQTLNQMKMISLFPTLVRFVYFF